MVGGKIKKIQLLVTLILFLFLISMSFISLVSAQISNGNVECWGLNGDGQSNPYNGGDAIQVSAGWYHTCIVKSNGNVECWGWNYYGQLNPYNNGDATQVSAGGAHTCVLKSNGNVECWGRNGGGQLNPYNNGDATQVSAGYLHTCILKSNGNVECWGWNYYGQSNDYTNDDVTQVSAGGYHTCILKSNGNVGCWGLNGDGQSNSYNGGDAIQVSAGYLHTCILKSNGNVECWGDNYYGQSNDYTNDDAIQVSAGEVHTCILKSNGNVECWGRNNYGQSNPYNKGDAIQVSAGRYHTCAMTKVEHCDNGVKDYDETDIDCGGSCPKCENGKQCLFDSDCQSNYCNGGICETNNCENGIKDRDETDIDCGGSCQKCSDGKGCLSRHDCVSDFCNSLNKCGCIDYDGDGESDIRCGGDDCNDNNGYTIKCPVLLVHGYTSDPSVWVTGFDFSGKLKNDGFTAYEIDYDPGEHIYDAMGDISGYANVLGDNITNILQNTKAAKVDIVAHSMGGLVSRWYSRFGYKDDVRKIIILGTPNHGSGLFNYKYLFLLASLIPKIGPLIKLGANLAIGKAGHQMTPCSRFLNMLNYNDEYICKGDDILTKNIYYATIGGNKSSWINKALFFGYENDGLVTINSLRLTGIEPPNFQKYYLGHTELREDQVVYDSVKNFLLTDAGYLALKVLVLKALKEETIIPVQEATYVNSKIDYNDFHLYNIPLSYANQATFILSWLNNSHDLKMVLINPNGTIINDSIENITYHASDVDNNITYEGFEVLNPIDGIWKVNISVTKGKNVSYTFLVLLDTNLYIDLYLNQSNSHLNSAFKIIVNVTNLNNSVLGANVTIEIKKPSGIIESSKLYDNLSLGSYSNTYSNTTELGIYEITAYVDGVLNDKPFHRQSTIQTEVYEPIDLYLDGVDIYFSNDNPTEGEEIQISAFIHNKGNVNLENISIEFYNDDPKYYGELIGESIINISANSYENVSILWNAEQKTRYIFVLISPFNSFIEDDYSNNIANKSISVKAKQLSSLNLSLNQGWNLISIPLNISDKHVNSIFNNTNITIFGYKNNSWFVPDEINNKLGYWLKINESKNLTLIGTEMENITMDLNKGWNLISYPSLNITLINESLRNVNNTYDLILTYENDKWLSYSPTRPYYLNTLKNLTPGYGYWVKVPQDVTWTFGSIFK